MTPFEKLIMAVVGLWTPPSSGFQTWYFSFAQVGKAYARRGIRVTFEVVNAEEPEPVKKREMYFTPV